VKHENYRIVSHYRYLACYRVPTNTVDPWNTQTRSWWHWKVFAMMKWQLRLSNQIAEIEIPNVGVINKAKLGRKENKFNLQAEAICNV